MKRIFLICLYLVCVFSPCMTADAQTREDRFREKFPYKYEFRVGWAGYPVVDGLSYRDRVECDWYYGNFIALDDIYAQRRGPSYMTGIISGEFSIHFKRWFTLSFSAGFNGLWRSMYDPVDNCVSERYGGLVFTFLPEARFNWINTRFVRMYSSVGLGIAAGGFIDEFHVYPAFQIAPVGIALGRRTFFFAESAIGSSWMGGKMGLGYRF